MALQSTPALNAGLRWELTGAAYNANEIYSSTTPEHLLGPSTAPFQPGVLNGVADPQIFLLTHPYKGDWVNPAPNIGVAWAPDKPSGMLGKILGHSVYGANFGVNYYDEGLITFQTAAGNGPGPIQSRTLDPGMPGFPRRPHAAVSLPFSVFPSTFAFPSAAALHLHARRASIDRT